jgi:hypothetical protein
MDKLKTGVCAHCGEAKKTDSALIHGRADRSTIKERREFSIDPNDYMELCRSCHMKYDMTDEIRVKISATSTGRAPSDEARVKMRKSAMGRKSSEEAKAKMSAARKVYWQNRV